MKLRKGVKQWNGRELEKVGIAEGKNGWHKCIPLFRISTSVSAAKLEKSKGYKRLSIPPPRATPFYVRHFIQLSFPHYSLAAGLNYSYLILCATTSKNTEE